jgi:hypothetical protein
VFIRLITGAGYEGTRHHEEKDPTNNENLLDGKHCPPSRRAGGCLDKGRVEIVDPGANKEAVFKSGQPDSQSERPTTQNDSLDVSILVSLKRNRIQRPTPQLTYFRSYGIEKWTVTPQPNF